MGDIVSLLIGAVHCAHNVLDEQVAIRIFTIVVYLPNDELLGFGIAFLQ